MLVESDGAFVRRHATALSKFWGRVRGSIHGWKDKYEWPRGIAGELALNKREELEQKIRTDLAKQAYLSKATFDSVMLWGFGTPTDQTEEEINRATLLAFNDLKEDKVAEAARQLIGWRSFGIRRASKTLALSNQDSYGIYDSRSADGLSDLADSEGRRLVLVQPGRSILGDRGRKKEEFCVAFERYTWVLRYLRRLALDDDALGVAFARVSDLEIAFFMRSRMDRD